MTAHLKAILPILLAALAMACGPADESDGHGDKPSDDHAQAQHGAAPTPVATLGPTPTPKGGPLFNERGEPLFTFDAELLLARRRTRQWIVELPIVIQLLAEQRGKVHGAVQISIECANQATYDEIEEKKESLKGPVADSLATKDLAWLKSARGKLKLKEEIVYRLRQSPLLENKAIRQVYFKQFVLRPAR